MPYSLLRLMNSPDEALPTVRNDDAALMGARLPAGIHRQNRQRRLAGNLDQFYRIISVPVNEITPRKDNRGLDSARVKAIRRGNCKIQEMWLLSLISRSVMYLEIEFCNYLRILQLPVLKKSIPELRELSTSAPEVFTSEPLASARNG